MEITTCSHKEQISAMNNGITTGECSICHQVRRYNQQGPIAIVEVIKIGRIDGKLVLPGPGEKLSLSAEEGEELKVARKSSNLVLKNTVAVEEQQEGQSSKEYYNTHKKEMISDLLIMGNAAFLAKWPVKGQIISHLKSDRLYKRQERQGAKVVKTHRLPSRPAGESKNGKLPSLPAFNESWPPYVKKRWLDAYVELCKTRQ